MAIKTKLVLAIFLFMALALCANRIAAGQEEEEVDPELKTCKHQCMQQQQYSKSDKRACLQSCERYHQMKKERERVIEEETRRKKEHEKEDEEEEEEEEEVENPFTFEDGDFESVLETEDGRVRVLPKFTRSKLLRGIGNFRLATLEAKGHTFVSPCHFDSEMVVFNVEGRATIGLVMEDTTDRFSLEAGEVMRVAAGTPIYVVNRDENQRLFLANFLIPLSTPGQFQAFYGPGGRDPKSFLTSFSWKVLEAALKTPRDKLKGIFKEQDKGSIFKISKDQVQSLSKVKRVIWPFGVQSDGPFKLLGKNPTISNQYGSLYQSTAEEPRLKDLNLILSFTNITKGSMTAPLYATRATKMCLVTDGEGYMEIVCPHVSSSSSHRGKDSPSYHRFSAHLGRGAAIAVPAGHPFLVVASKNNNLQILCFEVNARGNKILTFAGKKNVVKALDKEAKELAFNSPADRVDEVFNRDENFFFPGPDDTSEEREDHARAYA